MPTKTSARALALVIMLFGSLFLSMPLAIIGSEFDRAWKVRALDSATSLHAVSRHRSRCVMPTPSSTARGRRAPNTIARRRDQLASQWRLTTMGAEEAHMRKIARAPQNTNV